MLRKFIGSTLNLDVMGEGKLPEAKPSEGWKQRVGAAGLGQKQLLTEASEGSKVIPYEEGVKKAPCSWR